MDRESAWELCIAGMGGIAYGRRAAERLKLGPVEAVRFAGDPRRPRAPFDEFFAGDCAPAAALAAIAGLGPAAEHYITVLSERADLAAGYAAGGYDLTHVELLMARDLRDLPPPAPDIAVRLVSEPDEAAWLNANDPEDIGWIVRENLADQRVRHYAVLIDGQVACRGRNFRVSPDHGFASRVFTSAAYRRRGLARALMLRLLEDERERGASWSVLTASQAGGPLYAGLRYRALGTLQIFEPRPVGPA